MKNIITTLICIFIGHEFLIEFVSFFYTSDTLNLGILLPLIAGNNIGAGKRRRNAANEAKNLFRDSAQEGIGMFNDMYEDDYNLIQNGIGQFKNLANEFQQESMNPYLNSTEGKSFSNQIEENTDRSRRRFSNTASQMNLSDEAVVAGMNNINQAEGDSYRGLVSNATSRQAQLRGQRLSALSQVLGGQNQLLNQKMNGNSQGVNFGAGMAGQYNQGFQFEANRQANNNQAITGLLSTALTSLAASDKRLKDNIEPIEGALEKVLSLRGVDYTWKEDGRKDIGLIAQEVEEVFPEVVIEDQGIKKVNYQVLVGALVEAIRELNDKIE